MLRIFGLTGVLCAIAGTIVGVSSGSFWIGFWFYVVTGVILLPVAGYAFTPFLRDPNSDEG